MLLSGNTGVENSFSETDDSCPYSITLSIPIEFRGQYFYKMFVRNHQQSVSVIRVKHTHFGRLGLPKKRGTVRTKFIMLSKSRCYPGVAPDCFPVQQRCRHGAVRCDPVLLGIDRCYPGCLRWCPGDCRLRNGYVPVFADVKNDSHRGETERYQGEP